MVRKMKILCINGDYIQANSSANLCHLAYIRGLVNLGHEITLLSADGRDYQEDSEMMIPDGVKQYTYYGTTIYEKLSMKKRAASIIENNKTVSDRKSISVTGNMRRQLKKKVLSAYGVHGIYSKFVKKAQRFRSNEHYDVLISLSTPPSSHLLAFKLIKSGHVHCDKWIQIWEDPWYSDAYGFTNREEVFKEEKRLLSFAERICYVSPITLENQKKLFPESAEKMYWQPLPAYYSCEKNDVQQVREGLFGYFGAYHRASRDLAPFYTAAVKQNIDVNICGDPSSLFQSTDKIHIYPRMSLEKLKPFETQTEVLVFLCNRQGGQIPGKIYQYAATYKTILFILDGTEEEKRVLRDYFMPFNRFVFCENTVADIEQAICRILNDDYGNVVNRPLDEFEPVKIIQRILEEGAR